MNETLETKPDNILDELTDGFGASHYRSPNAGDLELEGHMNQSFEVGILLTGRQDRHLQDFVIAQEPGDVYLSPAWEPHGRRTTAPDTLLLVIHFLPEFLGEEAFEDLAWLSLFVSPPAERPRATTPQMRRQMLAIASEISEEITGRGRRWLASARLSLLRLLFTLARDWDPPHRTGRRGRTWVSDLSRIVPAVELVHAHLDRRVSLGEAAAACSFSPSQFHAVFRRAMGLTFGKFALRNRVAHAASVLLSTDLPLEAIAGEYGFGDASHLHHAFATQYGCTPAQYREQGRRRSAAEG